MTYHVRRSALPRPGTDEQLQEFVARIQPRAARPHRPLWEVYLVEGLEEGRFAIVTKSHQALVDGINAVDIAHVIVDGDPAAEGLVTDTWRPSREPSDVELLTGALVDAVRRPSEVVENIRGGIVDVKAVGSRALTAAGDVVSTLARTAARPAPALAAQRRGRRGPPLRHDRHRPRGLPQGPQPARPRQLRRRRQRSTTSSSPRSRARSAPGC